MMDIGFMTKYKISIKVPKTPPPGVPRRDIYLIRAYEYPEEWEGLGREEITLPADEIRLQLAEHGRGKGGHDRVFLLAGRDHDQGDRRPHGGGQAICSSTARSCAPGSSWPRAARTPTTRSTFTPATPFSSRAIATMTNGENTAFVPIRDYLSPAGVPGYIGYQSRLGGLHPYPALHASPGWGSGWRPTSTSSPRCRTRTSQAHPSDEFLQAASSRPAGR